MRLFFFPQSHHLLGVCGFSTCRWQCCEEYCCQHIFHQLQTPSCLGCFCWPVMISCGFSAIISSYNLTRFPDAIRGENVRKGPNSSNVYFCCLSAIFTRKKQVRRGGWTQHKYLKPKKLAVLREHWSLGKAYLLSAVTGRSPLLNKCEVRIHFFYKPQQIRIQCSWWGVIWGVAPHEPRTVWTMQSVHKGNVTKII